MDPVVFGVQVSTLLDRIATERAASGTVVRRPQPAVAVVEEEEPEAVEAAPIEEPPSTGAPVSTKPDDWSALLDAMRREIEVAQSSARAQPAESDPQPLDLDELARSLDANSRPAKPDKTESREPQTPEPAPPAPVAASAPERKKKVRRVPPQDEFGFFDPQQCGLSALFAKLDTISPPGKPVTPKKPS
jgi:hypothetical protein